MRPSSSALACAIRRCCSHFASLSARVAFVATCACLSASRLCSSSAVLLEKASRASVLCLLASMSCSSVFRLWDSHSASNSLTRFFEAVASLSSTDSFSKSSLLRCCRSSEVLALSEIFRNNSFAASSLLSNAPLVLAWALRSSSSNSCDSCSLTAAMDSAEAACSDILCTSCACFVWASLISSDFACKDCRCDSHSSSSSAAFVFHKATSPSRPEIFSKSSLFRPSVSSIWPCNFCSSSWAIWLCCSHFASLSARAAFVPT
mmetsp:Transcript_4812/g.10612  ORF Transcript_4812/g.10612 Transcript_4812/m.10612 type:complete len:262 (-) Transcript_4812:684-1469(-)